MGAKLSAAGSAVAGSLSELRDSDRAPRHLLRVWLLAFGRGVYRSVCANTKKRNYISFDKVRESAFLSWLLSPKIAEHQRPHQAPWGARLTCHHAPRHGFLRGDRAPLF